MGQEILYTSAPQGLRPGASGFCTVCSTAGMEPNLAEFLEGFSGYPHPFKPPDPRTKENPVNYSHVLWTIGGQRYSILSRVADAGLDYTGRTNLLAHHVALPRREAERCPGGPAWVLADKGFSIEKWDGQVKAIAPKIPRTDEKAIEKCLAWEAAAGDAGYAGVLAESIKDKGGRPVVVIYPSYLDTLPLLVEALSLLPPEKRWSVTFATLYSRIYSSFDCQWRFVFHESAEARTAKRDPNALVLDLTKGKLPKPHGGELVKLAQEGRSASVATMQPMRVAPSAAAAAPARHRPGAPPPTPLESADYKLAPPLAPGADLASLPPAEPFVNPFAKSNARRMSTALPVAAAFLGGIAITLIVAIAVVMNRPPPPVIATNANNKTPNKTPQQLITRPALSSEPVVDRDEGSRPNQVVVVDIPPEVATAPPPEPETVPEPEPASAPVEKPAEEPPPPAVTNEHPFADIAAKNKLLKLPLRGATSSLTQGKTGNNNGMLAQLYVAQPEWCQLNLQNQELAYNKAIAPSIVLEPDPAPQGTRRSWTVYRNALGTLSKRVALAKFALEKQRLSFKWEPALGVDPSVLDALRYCSLEIRVGEETVVCQLSEPEIVDAIQFKKMHLVTADFPLRGLQVSDPTALRLQVQPRGFDFKMEPKTIPDLKPEDVRKFFVFGESEEAGPVIAIGVDFLWPASEEPRNGDVRAVRAFGYVGFKHPDATVEESLKVQNRKLLMQEIDELIDGRKKAAVNLNLQAAKAEKEFKDHRQDAIKANEQIETEIKAIQANLRKSDLKGAAKKAAQELADKRIDALRAQQNEVNAELDGFKKAAEAKRQQHSEESSIVRRGEAIKAMAEKVIADASIEYQLVLAREGSSVVICRSRGFQVGRDF